MVPTPKPNTKPISASPPVHNSSTVQSEEVSKQIAVLARYNNQSKQSIDKLINRCRLRHVRLLQAPGYLGGARTGVGAPWGDPVWAPKPPRGAPQTHLSCPLVLRLDAASTNIVRVTVDSAGHLGNQHHILNLEFRHQLKSSMQ